MNPNAISSSNTNRASGRPSRFSAQQPKARPQLPASRVQSLSVQPETIHGNSSWITFHSYTDAEKYLDEDIPQEMQQMKNERMTYRGYRHAKWARELADLIGKGNFIPKELIPKYIPKLDSCIPTLKYWRTDTLINFFSHLTKIGFFHQSLDFNNEAKEKVDNLKWELFETINFILGSRKFEPVHAKNFVTLLMVIIDLIKYESNKNIVTMILTNLVNVFHSMDFNLSPYHYKHILDSIVNINNLDNRYEHLFNDLIEKHLSEIATLESTRDTNKELINYLISVKDILNYNFTSKNSFVRDIQKLLNNICLETDLEEANSGLHAISIFIQNNTINSDNTLRKKIERSLLFIDKEIENLDTRYIFHLFINISKIVKAHGSISSHGKIVLDKCSEILTKKLKELPLEQLDKMLMVTSNLFKVGYMDINFLRHLIDNLSEIKSEILDLPNGELHDFYLFFSREVEIFSARYHFLFNEIPKLKNLIVDLTKEYSGLATNTKLSMPTRERNLSFIAVIRFIRSGLLADDETKKLLNALYNIINNDIDSLSTEAKIDFFHYCNLIGGLIVQSDQDIKREVKSIINLSSEIFSKSHILSEKIFTFLWTMMVFCARNENNITKKEFERLKQEIQTIYESIDEKSIKREVESNIFILAQNFLGYQATRKNQSSESSSPVEDIVLHQLESKYTNLRFKREDKINELPPCDIGIPEHNIAIEIQGIFHYLDQERTLFNGATILKDYLYRMKNQKVIYLPVKEGKVHDQDLEICIDEINKATSKLHY